MAKSWKWLERIDALRSLVIAALGGAGVSAVWQSILAGLAQPTPPWWILASIAGVCALGISFLSLVKKRSSKALVEETSTQAQSKKIEPSALKIHSAFYGIGNANDVDVKVQIQQAAFSGSALHVWVGNNLIPGIADPAPNLPKRLHVSYSLGNNPVIHQIARQEHTELTLPEDFRFIEATAAEYERKRIADIEQLQSERDTLKHLYENAKNDAADKLKDFGTVKEALLSCKRDHAMDRFRWFANSHESWKIHVTILFAEFADMPLCKEIEKLIGECASQWPVEIKQARDYVFTPHEDSKVVLVPSNYGYDHFDNLLSAIRFGRLLPCPVGIRTGSHGERDHFVIEVLPNFTRIQG